MQKLLLTLPLVVALALGVMVLSMAERQRALEERIAQLERRPTSAPKAVAASPAEPAAAIPDAPAPVTAPRPVAEPAVSPTPPAALEPLAPAVQQAVAKEVERQLKERRPGVFAEAIRMEDPLTLMEKELGLSPSQKLRIGELWKKRDAEMMKQVEGNLGNLEAMKKVKEFEERYDLEIKRELDFAQQEKYDALKKQGRLHGGVVVQIEMTTDKK